MSSLPRPSSVAHRQPPAAPALLPSPRSTPAPSSLARGLAVLCLALAAALLALYYTHLTADFPHNSPWMDWAKYTDEGWYGDAAIRQLQLGHWRVPGDFNPAAALPVWPALELLLFRLTGVSLTAARALSVSVFAAILLCSWLLLRQDLRRSGPHRRALLGPAAAVLLLAASPFCFAFMRMAVLEPLLVLLTLLALLLANTLPAQPGPPRTRRALLLGLLLPLLVLTKTTGLFLAPSIAWLLFARSGYRLRPFLRVGALALGTALTLWLLYLGLLRHLGLFPDYHYLFAANAYTGITLPGALSTLGFTIRGGMWTGRVLFPLGLSAAVLTLLLPSLRRSPVAVSLVLWALGYGAFLAYHNNLQPRYYTVVAIPLTLLIPLTLQRLWSANPTPAASLLPRLGVAAATLALVLNTVTNARQTLRFALHPRYTFVNAAREVASLIRADRTHSPLLLSISGSDISLITGVPSICDDYGTLDLNSRVDLYHPGWYAAWNQIDDDKMDALTEYHLERVASIPAYDDPDRNLLILYRLDPESTRRPRHRHPTRPIPPRLQTHTGQQPSTQQLIH